MVESNAWDGSSLLFTQRNTDVAIIAANETNGIPMNKHLTRELLFPEYSQEFPHVAGTLGFGGRPGGPNFYFNLKDNDETHGLGGSTGSTEFILEEPDSCFAKIVHGNEIVNDMMKLIKQKSFNCIVEKIRLVPIESNFLGNKIEEKIL